ncbi:methylated-DNA--[protein]-cysteine S-methyltransferase [Chitinophaga oryziterrae]|uniref:Methylated-DNA--[protein]-cysteine S-methyltransferase n=1 Tax=Chitinophaga oryziterrae TaxID=1031224 RepID=A0A6N8JCX3_9BACT|nr:methylated-DNA--[protein]-cysteine S-methyltransferase [Chitinophaga oryziterrae]MVT42268.1 methylated-DNA--[protein]-cysteine S-methyltransferase [Chitinophaga oryziterrae]
MKTISIIPVEEDNLTISYSFANTRFGKVLIAATETGICYMAFADETENEAFALLHNQFPDAVYGNIKDDLQQAALRILEGESADITLHVKCTPFQLAIWKKLINLPAGKVLSYTALAGDVKLARAVGTAVAANPVAYLIPCHRVIKSNGEVGNYHWGSDRKAAMIKWENKKQITNELATNNS